MKNYLKSAAFGAGFGCSFFVFSLAKMSFIVGSCHAFFSYSSCFLPLAGAFGGFWATAALFLSSFFWVKNCGINLLLALPVANGAGSLYFSLYAKKWLACIIPLVCATFFIMHPQGSQVSWYTLFWVIPVLTALLPHNSFFLHALGSTFTSHAVGTVVWLYIKDLPASLFISLVPVVIVERLLFAVGMTLTYYALYWLQQNISAYLVVAEKKHA